MAMARSKLDEHRLKDADVDGLEPGDRVELGPFELELVHMTHSIPDSMAVALHCDLGTVLITGDYKFDQTPVDGRPADICRLAELGARRRPAALRRLDQRRPAGLLAQRVGRRPAPRGGLRALRGPDRRDVLRLEHPPRPAGHRRRGRATGARSSLVGRSMRKNVEHRPLARPHRPARRACSSTPREVERLARPQARDHLDRVPGRAAERAAADGLQRPPHVSCTRATRSSSARRRSPATSGRSTRRSTGSTTSAAT